MVIRDSDGELRLGQCWGVWGVVLRVADISSLSTFANSVVCFPMSCVWFRFRRERPFFFFFFPRREFR